MHLFCCMFNKSFSLLCAVDGPQTQPIVCTPSKLSRNGEVALFWNLSGLKLGLISVLGIRAKATEKATVLLPLVMRFTLPGRGLPDHVGTSNLDVFMQLLLKSYIYIFLKLHLWKTRTIPQAISQRRHLFEKKQAGLCTARHRGRVKSHPAIFKILPTCLLWWWLVRDFVQEPVSASPLSSSRHRPPGSKQSLGQAAAHWQQVLSLGLGSEDAGR